MNEGKMHPAKKVAIAGILLSLNIILNRLVGLAQVGPLFSWARIAPGTSIVLFASILLGPFYGAVVGVAGDALGWLILGQWTGTFNFFLSIYYAIVGIAPYFVIKLLKKGGNGSLAKVISISAFLALFLTAILAIWFSPSFATLFARANFNDLAAKIVITVIVLIGAVVTALSLFLMKKKEGDNAKYIAGVNLDMTFAVSIINEVIACLLKPLAFIAFYSLVLGNDFTATTGFDYGSLVVITSVFAMVNVPLNAYLLSLYCRYGKVGLGEI